MIPGAFDYHRPASLSDAIGLLGKLNSDARIVAGGHSLIPMMKLRLAAPSHLVDLGGDRGAERRAPGRRASSSSAR